MLDWRLRNLFILGVNLSTDFGECKERPKTTNGQVALEKTGRMPLSPFRLRGSNPNGKVWTLIMAISGEGRHREMGAGRESGESRRSHSWE